MDSQSFGSEHVAGPRADLPDSSWLDPQYAVGFFETLGRGDPIGGTDLREEHPRCSPGDANATRTESSVAIRPDPDARAALTASKTTVPNGYRLITRPSRGKRAGLRIQVWSRWKAVRSRHSGPGGTRSDSHFPSIVPGPFPHNSHVKGSRERARRGDEARRSDDIHLEGEASRFR